MAAKFADGPVKTGRTDLIAAAGYGLLCLLLWPVSVLQVLHVESAALVALVAFFVAGDRAFKSFSTGESLFSVLIRQELALLVPLLMLTLSLLWAPNKGYAWGLMFFFLFPVITVWFSVGLAYLLTASKSLARRGLVWLTGIFIALAGPLFDVGLHPQFYTFNHVFGGILGPLYDRQLTITSGLFVFRLLTLAWGMLFMFIGRTLRVGVSGNWKVLIGGGLALLIGCIYVWAPELGIRTNRDRIAGALGGTLQTPHFLIHYREGSQPVHRLRRIASDHEYHWARLKRITGLGPRERIESFIYPSTQVKAELTGARFTNVAPVWLAKPQLHITAGTFDASFPHELAHVFARDAGLPIIKASLSVGLVEGLAVALEPADGRPGTHEQVAAAVSLSDSLGYGTTVPLEDRVVKSLSPFGFWKGRSTVSYTTLGSFVRYLLDAYGVERFLSVYGGATWESAFSRRLETLVSEWSRFVRQMAPDEEVATWVGRRFARPSLFEATSPHYVPKARRLHLKGQRLFARGDSLGALQMWEKGLLHDAQDPHLLAEWGAVSINRSRFETVLEAFDSVPDSMLLSMHKLIESDARLCLGDTTGAKEGYSAAFDRTDIYDRRLRAVLALRWQLTGTRELVCRAITAADPETRAMILLEKPTSDSATELLLARALAAAGRYAEAIDRTPKCDRFSPAVLSLQCGLWSAETALETWRFDRSFAELNSAAAIALAIEDRAAMNLIEEKRARVRWYQQSHNRMRPR